MKGVYSQISQVSKKERFAKTVDIFQLLTVFAKYFISGVEVGSEYVSGDSILMINSKQ